MHGSQMLDNTAQHSTYNMKPTLTVQFDTSPSCVARACQHMQLTVNAKRLDFPQHGSLAKSSPPTATDHFYSGTDMRTKERRWLLPRLLALDRVRSFAHSMAVLSPDGCATYFENCTNGFRTAHVRVALRSDNRMPFLRTSKTVRPVDRFPRKVWMPRAVESTCAQHMSGRKLAAIPIATM